MDETASSNRPLRSVMPVLIVAQVRPRFVDFRMPASSTVAGRRRLYEHSIANALAVLSGRPADVVAAPAQPTTHKDVQP